MKSRAWECGYLYFYHAASFVDVDGSPTGISQIGFRSRSQADVGWATQLIKDAAKAGEEEEQEKE